MDTRVDRELDGVARLGLARERCDGVVPAGVILGAGERVVHDALDTGGAVLLAHVAHHVRGHIAVGIGAGVGAVLLLQRLGQRHAVGRDDGAALDVLGAGDGVVVGRHVLVVLGLDDLDIGEVADKDGEQRRKGEHGAGEAVCKRHAAKYAGLGRVEQATAHARTGGVAAAAVRRRGGKARAGRGCG